MQRVPPLTANVGKACYKCFEEDTEPQISLQRCAACFRVSYCSPQCQKADWRTHKSICKALRIVDAGRARIPLPEEPSTDMGHLNKLAEQQAIIKLQLCEGAAYRALNLIERNLIGWEPRCMACTRTSQNLRTESQNPQSRYLQSCHDCGLSFYCSDQHWDVVRQIHSREPCEDGHDGISQCQLNQEIRSDIAFSNTTAAASPTLGQFVWAPNRTKLSWTPLSGLSWQDEYEVDVAREFSVPAGPAAGPYIRAVSNALSMPMTILWALENLCLDNSWTHKKRLTIHILGAFEEEIKGGLVFEEILHRLPDVMDLELVFCGPQISELFRSEEIVDMEICGSCHRRGRKRTHQHFGLTYHDFVQRRGSKYMIPDLAIAFNSGASQESVASWRTTINLLVKLKIPTTFTAYNREEAEGEAKILRDAGAQLMHDLGPKKNPWGSILAKKEPNKVIGFYAVNGWLAGGFR